MDPVLKGIKAGRGISKSIPKNHNMIGLRKERRTMTREEFEAWLLKELKKIRKKYHEYCPEDPYLSMTIGANDSDYILANNTHWKCWCEHEINMFWKEEK